MEEPMTTAPINLKDYEVQAKPKPRYQYVSSADVADVLALARAEIATRGWCQRHMAMTDRYGSIDDPYDLYYIPRGDVTSLCTIGAVTAAAYWTERSWRVVEACEDALRLAIGGADVAVWNDWDSRQEHEVLAAVDRAIRLIESGEH